MTEDRHATRGPTADDPTPGRPADERSRRWVTIPNALSLFRWIGAAALVVLAWADQPRAFVVWYLLLAASDWLDGKLAVGLHQRTVLGARLDSFADATVFLTLGLGSLLLWNETIVQELAWISVAVVAYAIATAAGLWKYGRWPSYHTRSAKSGWAFMILAVIFMAWEGSRWPLRIAMVWAALTNVESLWITLRSTRWHADVIGFWALPRIEAEAAARDSEGEVALTTDGD